MKTSRATAGRNVRFRCGELNLVLRDRRRLHVVCHGGLEQLQADALKIAGFLERPVWDATRG